MASRKLGILSAALILAGAASAATAQSSASLVRNINFSTGLQEKLDKDYGLREADVLKRELQRSVDHSLKGVGKSKVAYVDLTIGDAKPNKPTFKQLSQNTSLSFSDSKGTGGAEIEAKLYDASGALIGTVSHKYFSINLQDVWSSYPWSDADRAFDGAAYKIRKEAQRGS